MIPRSPAPMGAASSSTLRQVSAPTRAATASSSRSTPSARRTPDHVLSQSGQAGAATAGQPGCSVTGVNHYRSSRTRAPARSSSPGCDPAGGVSNGGEYYAARPDGSGSCLTETYGRRRRPTAAFRRDTWPAAYGPYHDPGCGRFASHARRLAQIAGSHRRHACSQYESLGCAADPGPLRGRQGSKRPLHCPSSDTGMVRPAEPVAPCHIAQPDRHRRNPRSATSPRSRRRASVGASTRRLLDPGQLGSAPIRIPSMIASEFGSLDTTVPRSSRSS